MTWEIGVIAAYFLIGATFSWMASIGHKRLHGRPLSWHYWVAGTFGWPVVFLVAKRKK